MILSILIGVFLIVYNFKIDDSYIEYTLSTLALCVSPVGLFAIGIILSFHCDNVINKLTISISFLKLVITLHQKQVMILLVN